MHISQTALTLLKVSPTPWTSNWLWGCPLIIITVIFHAWCLATMSRRIVIFEKRRRGQSTAVSALLVATMTLLSTFLHAIDALIWSVAYRIIGVLPDARSAMLYSLGAMTTFGSAATISEPQWQLLGAIEALNGILLFGLSTAFLFWLLQEILPTLRS